jgi:ankyrin repeat protein
MPQPTGVADAVVAAIHRGDLAAIRQLLAEHPGLASAPLGGRYETRTPLQAVTDWPGYFPNGPEIVRLLIVAGAEPDAGVRGDETPLHWAASSDDWHVAAALIDAGADINAPDGSIGAPLANAVGYGCWDVARLLVAHDADVDQPWMAPAMGLLDPLG